MGHSFHIPVLGIGFSVDTSVKVAPLGISSVASVVDDILLEKMREYYTTNEGNTFVPISEKEAGYRSKRITAYLNMIAKMVSDRFQSMQDESLAQGGQLCRYFELLPANASLKIMYMQWLSMNAGVERHNLEQQMKAGMKMGAVDVNIMAKVDKLNLNSEGEILNSDALEALKGFAESNLESSVVLSAGMNPRLYSYLEQFPDFFPDAEGYMRKKVILKVSDYRSAYIQAKFLAKKGIWISEFRIESGLNCGGHAFATEGYLLGPILEEFKLQKSSMKEELFALYQKALVEKGINCRDIPAMKISVQGGIGTTEENKFLLEYYEVDATGWGSPFLLVPEVVNIDDETLQALSNAGKDDFYISSASPLGVPFNNFHPSAAEKQRLERIVKGKPGSPCTKKYLVSNTEFSKEPICTASRKYQSKKLQSLKTAGLSEEEYTRQAHEVTAKLCLCEGLVTSVFIKNGITRGKNTTAAAICPGPNLAYFSGVFSLDEMVNHIYGNVNLLKDRSRPHMFINELNLYVEYLKKDIEDNLRILKEKKLRYLAKFKSQLEQGIQYYYQLIPKIKNQTDAYREKMKADLKQIEARLAGFPLETL